jgi:hypothetical protein
VASLKSISAKGEVIITFSEEMNVPPLNVIKATKVTLKGRVVPALELEIKAGFYSEVDNLTFSYNITSYTARQIVFQLNFDHPILISANDDPETLIVKFNAKYFFFTKWGRSIQ